MLSRPQLQAISPDRLEAVINILQLMAERLHCGELEILASPALQFAAAGLD